MSLSERLAEARAKVLALSQPQESQRQGGSTADQTGMFPAGAAFPQPQGPPLYRPGAPPPFPAMPPQPDAVAGNGPVPGVVGVTAAGAPITPHDHDPLLSPGLTHGWPGSAGGWPGDAGVVNAAGAHGAVESQGPAASAPTPASPMTTQPGQLGTSPQTLAPNDMSTHASAGAASAPPTLMAGHLEILAKSVRADVVASLGSDLTENRLDDEDLRRRTYEAINTALLLRGAGLSPEELDLVGQTVMNDTLGLGPLEELLSDEHITEIMVNGPDCIYVEREGRISSHHASFRDEEHLRRTIDRIVARVGRRIDEAAPMVDARLQDGSRVHAAIPPAVIDGAVLTVRKFRRDTLDMDQLVALGSVTPDAAAFLACCVQGKLNIVVSGGTGTGKTTLLSALSAFIPDDERIITIEDAAELQLDHSHLVRMESRPPGTSGQGEITIRDLLRNALRMRPDRIIVGEVRDAAALDMLQAMSTGHNGSLGTVHASSGRDALRRVETMVLFAGLELPLRAVRDQIASGIDVLVHLERQPGGVRKVVEIAEVSAMEGEVITLQPLFGLRDSDAALVPTGFEPGFWPRIAAHMAALGVQLHQQMDHVGRG